MLLLCNGIKALSNIVKLNLNKLTERHTYITMYYPFCHLHLYLNFVILKKVKCQLRRREQELRSQSCFLILLSVPESVPQHVTVKIVETV